MEMLWQCIIYHNLYRIARSSRVHETKSVSVMDHACLDLCHKKKHECILQTGVFLLLNRVCGTLCLSHYVTEISHLYSLRDFWRHFGLCRAAAHSDCCFLRSVQIFLLTDLLTYSHDPATVIRDEVGATGKKHCVGRQQQHTAERVSGGGRRCPTPVHCCCCRWADALIIWTETSITHI